MSIIPDIAISAIIAAIIAGIISLLGLIISKENKTSEFRQLWIDSLREEVARLISHANAIHGALSLPSKDVEATWKIIREDFIGINEATAKIRLRLNPVEPKCNEIIESISKIENILKPGQYASIDELNNAEKTLVSQTQIVLKDEWKRVKSGELAYKLSKYISILVILILIMIVFVNLIKLNPIVKPFLSYS